MAHRLVIDLARLVQLTAAEPRMGGQLGYQ